MPFNSEQNDKPIEPVCRALEENLNEFCDEPPVVCGLLVAPRFAEQITFPAWQPVELDGQLDVVERIFRAQWASIRSESGKEQVWGEFRSVVEPALRNGRLSLSSAELDLYELGKPYRTYRIDTGVCDVRNANLKGPPSASWNLPLADAQVFVFLAPEAVEDIEKTYRNRARSEPEGDVFLFEGRPYAYTMFGYRNDGRPVDNLLIVYKGSNDTIGGRPAIRPTQVCTLKYNYRQ